MLVAIAALVTIEYSGILGYGIMDRLNASVYYVMPVAVYALLVEQKLDSVKFLKVLSWVVVTCGVMAVLFMAGVLSNVGNEEIESLERTSTLFDGGLGLVGVAIALHFIMHGEKDYSFFYKYITLISGVLIVLSGQSRARIILLVVVVVLSIFFSMLKSEEKQGHFFTAIFVILVTVIAAMGIFQEYFVELLDNLTIRFEAMGTDNSSFYRVAEREHLMELFSEHPLAGAGWGRLNYEIVQDMRGAYHMVSNHNMYASVLAIGGLAFAIPFFFWLFKVFWVECKNFRTSNYARLNMVLMIVIFVLSISSAGFMKYSQMLAIMVVYVTSIERENKLFAEQTGEQEALRKKNLVVFTKRG